MSRLVLLDAGPLGLVSHPDAIPAARDWLRGLIRSGAKVVVPEIADYEVRRELLRAGKTRSIRHLDAMKEVYFYLPLTTATMLQAAEYWAQARRKGKPASEAAALDADCILAAQAAAVTTQDNEVVVATTNPGHLSLFVDAHPWQEIR